MRIHAAVGRGNFILRRLAQKSFLRIFGIQLLFVAFSLLIASSLLTAPARQCVWDGVEKIIAIGDLHGDYDHFVTILKNENINLVDEKLNWIGGKTHLVQIGDVLDRGDHAKDIFDLIKRLEKEAAAAGGKVHMLIGNHEEINIMERYFDYPEAKTVGQFISFLPDEYRKQKEKEFKKKTENGGDSNDEWKKLMDDPKAQEVYNENFNLLYGRWIAEEHNAVIKINDTVFVHGGISEKYSTWKLQDINDRLYKEFQKWFRGDSFKPTIIFDEEGPLWFRRLAEWDQKDYLPQVDKILSNLKAKHMVIAHTPVVADNMKRFGDKVYVIDTGISSIYKRAGGFLSALIIENGNFKTWKNEYGP
jgi:hypothetical protein